MAIINWPSTLKTGAVDYAIEFDVQMNIARNGHITTYGLPGARWLATITFEPELETMQRPLIEALITSLEGGANRLSMQHLGRPLPNGAMRGTPVLQSAVSAGARILPIANANGGLKAGDIIGLPGQMVMVTADANPVSSAMSVSVTPAIRQAYTTSTPVTWNKPTVLWIPKTSIAGPFPFSQNLVRPGFSIELVEAY